ncbi:hypothetical protein [Rhodovarius lipocyclicus]|uniref:hypothetical protein n=1 Tax=Rhodovarius lipocyclicus TaxID=268410 RepID=UPI001359A51F|nr:hypothetical protein [Rhodovarius lipocyclicus]
MLFIVFLLQAVVSMAGVIENYQGGDKALTVAWAILLGVNVAMLPVCVALWLRDRDHA